jgi:hypothetical protein
MYRLVRVRSTQCTGWYRMVKLVLKDGAPVATSYLQGDRLKEKGMLEKPLCASWEERTPAKLARAFGHGHTGQVTQCKCTDASVMTEKTGLPTLRCRVCRDGQKRIYIYIYIYIYIHCT